MPVKLMSVSEWLEVSPTGAQGAVSAALNDTYTALTLQARFDALAELIQQCNTAIAAGNDAAAYSDLQKQATQFAAGIVDAKDENDLTTKIAARNKFKAVDPDFMPWQTIATRTDVTQVETRKDYLNAAFKDAATNIRKQKFSNVNADDAKNDKEVGVNYFETAEERESHRIFIAGGKFKKIDNDGENLFLNDFDTQSMAAHGHENSCIFVVSPKGEMFAGTTINEEFHHSTFLAGKATAFAGVLSVTNGNLQKMEDNSGHYLPGPQQLVAMLTFLRETGVLRERPESQLWNNDLVRLETVSNVPTIKGWSIGAEGLTFQFNEKLDLDPLLIAAKANDFAQVEALLDNGANPNLKDEDGRTLLALAAIQGNIPLFNKVMEAGGAASLNEPDRFGMTPLLLAVAAGNYELTESLLENGANPNFTNNMQMSALTMATWNSDVPQIEKLLEMGANPAVDENRLLTIALQKHSVEIFQVLMREEFQVDFSNAMVNAIDSGELNGVITLLSLMQNNQYLSSELKESLDNIGLPSIIIDHLGGVPTDDQQNFVNQLLSQKNALGQLLDGSQMEVMVRRLQQNGYADQVDAYKETQSAAVQPLAATSSTSAILDSFQSHSRKDSLLGLLQQATVSEDALDTTSSMAVKHSAPAIEIEQGNVLTAEVEEARQFVPPTRT